MGAPPFAWKEAAVDLERRRKQAQIEFAVSGRRSDRMAEEFQDMNMDPAVFTLTMTQRDISIHASLHHPFQHFMGHS